MSKLVLRTAAITLAAIVALCGIVSGVLVLFFPGTLARFFMGAGNSSAAVVFYERQYKKTGDFGDLRILCDTVSEYSSSDTAEKYLGKFVTEQGFSEFCADFDKQYGVYTYSSREYYCGRFVVARFINSGIEQAADSAKDFVAGGYTEYNPFYWLIADGQLSFSNSDAQVLESMLKSIEAQGESNEYLQRDLSLIKQLCK